MVKRLALISFVLILLWPQFTHAQSERQIFSAFRKQENDLSRYEYLEALIPQLPPDDKIFAGQLLATTEANLGLYHEAIRDFPFDSRLPPRRPPPRPEIWPDMVRYDLVQGVNGEEIGHPSDAVDAISELAASKRIVLINESHHDAHTRELTLQLLPRLRAMGFTHFAAEALTEDGASVARRGFPLTTTGTEYMREPLYGEILREAIRLGYVIVSYDPTDDTIDRDDAQARKLYEQVLARYPNARLFVHAGYAHIDKTSGNLPTPAPLAMRLMQLTHSDVLSIDQTQFRDTDRLSDYNPYRKLITDYRPRWPIVLKFGSHATVWSSDPAKYDVSVILPDDDSEHGRPRWLTLRAQRIRWPIPATLCSKTIPCVVEAHYANEPDNAVAADRYTFILPNLDSVLYLRPGSYRVGSWGMDGKTLREQSITINPQ